MRCHDVAGSSASGITGIAGRSNQNKCGKIHISNMYLSFYLSDVLSKYLKECNFQCRICKIWVFVLLNQELLILKIPKPSKTINQPNFIADCFNLKMMIGFVCSNLTNIFRNVPISRVTCPARAGYAGVGCGVDYGGPC